MRIYRAKSNLFHADREDGITSRRTGQRASPRMPPERRVALVVSDFFAPLWTPTLFPPLWIFSPEREGTDWARGFRWGCIVFRPAILRNRRWVGPSAHEIFGVAV